MNFEEPPSPHSLLLNFVVQIANINTRNAYYRACSAFLRWLEAQEILLHHIKPIHVATWRELMLATQSIATVKLALAANRSFFDWLTVHHHIALNPASPVKSPRETVAIGKTVCLEQREARSLLASIDCSTVLGLRDQALIALMLFTFARIGAALNLACDDVFSRAGSSWISLHEKGGKIHEMPLHHQAERIVLAYLKIAASGPSKSQALFQSYNRKTGQLSGRRLLHANAYAMVQRRARAAGITTVICNHTFRATGITAFLSNGGTLEMAAKLANHASTRTTQLYDRRQAEMKVNEVERISF